MVAPGSGDKQAVVAAAAVASNIENLSEASATAKTNREKFAVLKSLVEGGEVSDSDIVDTIFNLVRACYGSRRENNIGIETRSYFYIRRKGVLNGIFFKIES